MSFIIFMRTCVIYYFFIYIVKNGSGKRVSYTGAQVWRTQLKNPKDAETIITLVDKQAISLWKMNNQYVDYLVQASKQHKVYRELDKRRLSTSMLIEDVQSTLDSLKQNKSKYKDTSSLRGEHPLDWKSFPKLRVIEEFLEYLATKFPERCTVTIIGHSVEKRTIQMLRISNGNPSNKVIVMTAGIHAREWIAITSALYLIDYFTLRFNQLPSYVTSLDWVIIPVLNPDGYEYSRTKDRLWRKNRQKRPTNENEPHCVGVDLNRNFGFSWLRNNKSACSESHSGSQAFSEPESRAIRDLIENFKPVAFIDVHTYGQMILYPWCSRRQATNIVLLKSTASEMAKNIKRTTIIADQNYIHGECYSLAYPAYGTQSDWFYSKGVNHSYIFEMRGSLGGKTKGFLLPESSIIPTGDDLVAAMKQLAKTLETNNHISPQSHDEVLIAIFHYATNKLFNFLANQRL